MWVPRRPRRLVAGARRDELRGDHPLVRVCRDCRRHDSTSSAVVSVVEVGARTLAQDGVVDEQHVGRGIREPDGVLVVDGVDDRRARRGREDGLVGGELVDGQRNVHVVVVGLAEHVEVVLAGGRVDRHLESTVRDLAGAVIRMGRAADENRLIRIGRLAGHRGQRDDADDQQHAETPESLPHVMNSFHFTIGQAVKAPLPSG